jgi:Tol biopolymer transport system component
VSDDSGSKDPGGQRSARLRWPIAAAAGAVVLVFGFLAVSYFYFKPVGKPAPMVDTPGPVRLTNNGFDEDAAAWTSDDRIRFIRFTAVNKVESMIMDADGSDQQRAGGEIRDFRAGTWSPDGKKILYGKEGISSRITFVANADGSNEQQLPFAIGPFDWSPDGRNLVFSKPFPSEADNSEIILFSFETGELTNLTNDPGFDANPSFSPDGRQIIFNSARDGNAEIYLMNADGTGLRRLTNDPAKEAFQAFSPDGTQIAFNSNRENEKVGVYLMNVHDDSPPVKVTDTRYNAEIRPGCWSRDGTRIVFTSDMGGEKFNVYTMAVESTNIRKLLEVEDGEIRSAAPSPDRRRFALAVKTPAGGGELRVADIASGKIVTIASADNYDLMPTWSPDGGSIAFAMKTGGNTEIVSIRPDGSGQHNLTNNEARDGGPAYSPDGTKIIFSSDRDGRSEVVNLFVMNSDGSDLKRLTSRSGYEMTPAWSPDGRTIAYACDRTDGKSQVLDIFIADINEPEKETILATRRFHDTNPGFSPDGSRIAFVGQSDGNFEIYLVNVDGSRLVRLTRNAGDDLMPVFSDDGSKIYFVSNRAGKFALYEMTLT